MTDPKTAKKGEKQSQNSSSDRAIWTMSEETCPRKQLRRSQWATLNGEWDFAFDNQRDFHQPWEVKNWAHKIKVPFCPESKASGVNDTGFHWRVWYRRTFEVSKNGDNRVLLHFGAIDYEARVWVNGQFIGFHRGGHTPFSFEITEFLNDDGHQIVAVCADDDPHDLAKPRGKQDWQLEPHSIWYPRTTGIWQNVWMEEVPRINVDRIVWSPALERWEVGFEAFLQGPRDPGLQMRIKLTCGERLLADDTYTVINHEVHRRIALSDPGIDDFRNEMLWSPEKPTLIDATITLLRDGKVIDEVKSYTALRSVNINRGRFLLNGRPYYMRLILDQGYWPDTMMTPPSTEALIKDIELVKAAGFNGVRKHQKVEDPEFLYLADKMGLLVWGEMPSAYRFTQDSVDRITREWLDVIHRDMNHPCVVVWVPFNESWGVPDLAEKVAHQNCVQALYHLTKTLDPHRPVIGNDGWESTATDILGIHDYDDRPDRLYMKYSTSENVGDALNRYRPGGRVITVEGYPHEGQPIMLTEFGGIAFVDHKDNQTWGYSVSASSEDFRKKYENLLTMVNRIELFMGFCYTQFTDTFQEANGLFRMDRTPKFSVNAMAHATRGMGYTRGELTTVPQPPPIPEDDHGVGPGSSANA